MPNPSQEGRRQNSIDNRFTSSTDLEDENLSRVQNNLVVQQNYLQQHRRPRQHHNSAQKDNFNAASKNFFNSASDRLFSQTEPPTTLKHSRRRHNQDHKENSRAKTSKNRNCTLNVKEDKTFLWRIDTQPPSYFFGTIHVPYTRVWDAVSDNAKKAFKVCYFIMQSEYS